MPTQEIRQRVHERLEELYQRHLPQDESDIASYYTPGIGYHKPQTLTPEQQRFAICVATVDGEVYCAGDHDARFALQSISKVFLYGLALEMHGRERVLERVGVDPSGDAYDSISLLFDERNNRPYNPMVNAGALVTTDLVENDDGSAAAEKRILSALGRYADNESLKVDEDVFTKMLQTSDRNRAMSYLMRSVGMISQDVEENLALYLRHCAVHVSCSELAVMGATLANGGVNPATSARALDISHVQDVLSVMLTCGMYDFAGQWTYRVGIPAKSGVSGGILGVVPGKLGIGVFSPGLDVFGNSVRGVHVCEEISRRLGLHIFANDGEDALLGPGTPQTP